MANSVEDSIRWKLWQAVKARLETITIGGGYNTQPLVTEEWSAAYEFSGDYAIWVHIGDEVLADAAVNTRITAGVSTRASMRR